jgi:hypothetical protein
VPTLRVSGTQPVPLLIQVAAVTIDDNNKRASITAVGGAEFEVNDGGIFPVQVSPTSGRRLLQVRPPEWELAGPASRLRGWRRPWKHARSAQFNLR